MSIHNKKTLVGAGILFALPFTFAIAGLAMAHPQGRCGPGDGPPTPEMQAKMQKCRAEHHATMLAELDKDKDGKISREERRLGHESRKADRLAEFDKDKSGDLSAAERKDARHAKLVEEFESLDTNSDAEISKAEAEAGCSRASRHVEKLDADANGSVTWAEFEAGAKEHMKRGRRRMKAGKRHHRGMRGNPRGMKGKHRGLKGNTDSK